MLNLNDDMDDLIRQAAEDYPLKIEGKDWDKVLGAMSTATQVQPAKGKKHWWLLLLLLPLLLLIAVPFMNKKGETQKTVTYSNTQKTDIAKEKQNNDGLLNKDNTATKEEATSSISASKVHETASKEEQNLSQLNNNPNTNTTATINNRKIVSAEDIINNKTQNIAERSNSDNRDNTISEKKAAIDITNNNSIGNNTQAANNSLTPSEQTNNVTNKKENISTPIDSSNSNKLALAPPKDNTLTTKKMDLQHTTPIKKGFYIGAAAGLDISTVKLHKTSKIGYSIATIVGYRINNRWSIESGLMWDTKHYYSPGEYFDKSRTGVPEASYIHYLNGTCRMFEVPLNVKFDFNRKKNSGFYVSAGLSSYFMKNEDYEYHATNNGVYYVRSKEYKNSTNNLFSVANINGGYQFILKNGHSVRIEPYVKIPLTGLGIGKLPFSSAGISAGYTLPLR